MLNWVCTELSMVALSIFSAADGLASSRVVENGKVEREVQAMHTHSSASRIRTT